MNDNALTAAAALEALVRDRRGHIEPRERGLIAKLAQALATVAAAPSLDQVPTPEWHAARQAEVVVAGAAQGLGLSDADLDAVRVLLK
jgi:hypothetical protein